jgi:hypothetical protein
VDARSRASAHLGSLVAADGALHGRCSSRVLESMLLLSLLRKTRRHPHVQDALVRYLRTAQSAAADPFSHALAAAATGPDLSAGASPLRFLDGFDHFTAARKRFMFRTTDGEPRRRCLAYLIAQQHDNGSFSSLPDQAPPPSALRRPRPRQHLRLARPQPRPPTPAPNLTAATPAAKG